MITEWLKRLLNGKEKPAELVKVETDLKTAIYNHTVASHIAASKAREDADHARDLITTVEAAARAVRERR